MKKPSEIRIGIVTCDDKGCMATQASPSHSHGLVIYNDSNRKMPVNKEIDQAICTGQNANIMRPDSERIIQDTFFLGTFPGLSDEQIEYVIDLIEQFVRLK